MGYLFWEEGITAAAPSPFSTIQSNYWSSTEIHVPQPNSAWSFNFGGGFQGFSHQSLSLSAWAVHSGDVGVAIPSVPVPAAVWLFGSGLLGLIGIAKRKKA